MTESFPVECENCGHRQRIHAGRFPECDDCGSANLTQQKVT